MKKALIFSLVAILVALFGCGKKNSNKAPIITSPQEITSAEDTSFAYTAEASDPEGASVTIAFSDYPYWLSPSDNLITGNVPWGFAETTIVTFTVIASDGHKNGRLPVNIKIIPTNEFYISLMPHQETKSVGNQGILTANINCVENLFTTTFDINYDSTIIRVDDVRLPASHLLGNDCLCYFHRNPGGISVCTGNIQTAGNDNVTGGGHLVEISYTAIAAGTCALGYANVLIFDESGTSNTHMGDLIRGSSTISVH